jgi:hypothetical protein
MFSGYRSFFSFVNKIFPLRAKFQTLSFKKCLDVKIPTKIRRIAGQEWLKDKLCFTLRARKLPATRDGPSLAAGDPCSLPYPLIKSFS